MLGRQRRHLIIRLIKAGPHSLSHHIVIARKKARPNSRLDRIGSLSTNANISFLKLDILKLTKYLVRKNIIISGPVMKILGDIRSLFLSSQKANFESKHNKFNKKDV